MNEQRHWFSVPEAANYFGLKSAKTLYSLAGRGRLPEGAVLRIGRQLRIRVDLIEEGAMSARKGRHD